MATKQIVFRFEELSHLEIYCPDCKSGFLFNAEPSSMETALKTDCHVCGAEFPKNLATVIGHYRQFFHSAHGLNIEFRVELNWPTS